MAETRKDTPTRADRNPAPRSGEPYGEVRGYGIDNAEAEEVARHGHGAHPEPPREKGDEVFEEQE